MGLDDDLKNTNEQLVSIKYQYAPKSRSTDRNVDRPNDGEIRAKDKDSRGIRRAPRVEDKDKQIPVDAGIINDSIKTTDVDKVSARRLISTVSDSAKSEVNAATAKAKDLRSSNSLDTVTNNKTVTLKSELPTAARNSSTASSFAASKNNSAVNSRNTVSQVSDSTKQSTVNTTTKKNLIVENAKNVQTSSVNKNSSGDASKEKVSPEQADTMVVKEALNSGLLIKIESTESLSSSKSRLSTALKSKSTSHSIKDSKNLKSDNTTADVRGSNAQIHQFQNVVAQAPNKISNMMKMPIELDPEIVSILEQSKEDIIKVSINMDNSVDSNRQTRTDIRHPGKVDDDDKISMSILAVNAIGVGAKTAKSDLTPGTKSTLVSSDGFTERVEKSPSSKEPSTKRNSNHKANNVTNLSKPIEHGSSLESDNPKTATTVESIIKSLPKSIESKLSLSSKNSLKNAKSSQQISTEEFTRDLPKNSTLVPDPTPDEFSGPLKSADDDLNLNPSKIDAEVVKTAGAARSRRRVPPTKVAPNAQTTVKSTVGKQVPTADITRDINTNISTGVVNQSVKKSNREKTALQPEVEKTSTISHDLKSTKKITKLGSNKVASINVEVSNLDNLKTSTVHDVVDRLIHPQLPLSLSNSESKISLTATNALKSALDSSNITANLSSNSTGVASTATVFDVTPSNEAGKSMIPPTDKIQSLDKRTRKSRLSASNTEAIVSSTYSSSKSSVTTEEVTDSIHQSADNLISLSAGISTLTENDLIINTSTLLEYDALANRSNLADNSSSTSGSVGSPSSKHLDIDEHVTAPLKFDEFSAASFAAVSPPTHTSASPTSTIPPSNLPKSLSNSTAMDAIVTSFNRSTGIPDGSIFNSTSSRSED